jgi:hypothetical protein
VRVAHAEQIAPYTFGVHPLRRNSLGGSPEEFVRQGQSFCTVPCSPRSATLDDQYNRVILDDVKTAISVPDETFEQVDQRARSLGMSRSEFYTVAARHYLQVLEARVTTEQINDALAALEEPDDSTAVAAQAGRRRLLADDADW